MKRNKNLFSYKLYKNNVYLTAKLYKNNIFLFKKNKIQQIIMILIERVEDLSVRLENEFLKIKDLTV